VALMTSILETSDLVCYADVQGQLEWEKDVQIEMNALIKNHTWDLVPRRQGKNIVECRWVYKTKSTSKGVVERHKYRLVTKAFSQQEGINYTNTFSSVAKMNYV
jgi:S-adenosylmethionine:tRNA-ribosyltransferase-isomerase (queuine synthetase)